MSIGFLWIITIERFFLDHYIDQLFQDFRLHEVLLRCILLGKSISQFQWQGILSNVLDSRHIPQLIGLLDLLSIFENKALNVEASLSDHWQLGVWFSRFITFFKAENDKLLLFIHGSLSCWDDGSVCFRNELEDGSDLILIVGINLLQWRLYGLLNVVVMIDRLAISDWIQQRICQESTRNLLHHDWLS